MWLNNRESQMNNIRLSMFQCGYHPNLHFFFVNNENASLTNYKTYGVHITLARDRRNHRLHCQQRLTNQCYLSYRFWNTRNIHFTHIFFYNKIISIHLRILRNMISQKKVAHKQCTSFDDPGWLSSKPSFSC